jgi:hypothetical protein
VCFLEARALVNVLVVGGLAGWTSAEVKAGRVRENVLMAKMELERQERMGL